MHHVDRDARKVTWTPACLQAELPATEPANPLETINQLLLAKQSQGMMLRPQSELVKEINASIGVRRENPFLEYQIHGLIGMGSFGHIYKAVRIRDKKLFALKYSKEIGHEQ